MKQAMVLALVLLTACGSSPSGPSGMTAAPAALPAGLDPTYVRMLARLDTTSGRPQRWEGGPMHHCFDAIVAPYRAQLETVADRLAEVSGIPRTQDGPCNVEWVGDPHESMPATTYASGTVTSIVKATVRIQRPQDLFNARPAAILHEGGHVLGLRHSDRPEDVMNPDVVVAHNFSRDELAVLAWMYQH